MEELDILRDRLKRLEVVRPRGGSTFTEIGEWLIDIGRLNLQLASRALDASARMKEAEK